MMMFFKYDVLCCDEKCISEKKDLFPHCYVAKQFFQMAYFTDILSFEKFYMNLHRNLKLIFCFQRYLFILKSVIDRVL